MLQPSPAFTTRARPRALMTWLFAVAPLIVAIVVVGGITRLTESGLSITQWQPITGVIPPLTDAEWQAEFANYRRIPQYAAVHPGMTLAGFKGIFFWEYLHRLLARVIGSAFALPLLWFAVRRQIPRGYAWRLVALLALGGLQGSIGWIMVESGLAPDRVEVAPALLAAHLVTALVTLSGVIWTALDLRALARDPFSPPASLTATGALTGAALLVQLVLGALMAGLRAGLVTNEWPLMNGRVFPGTTQSSEGLAAILTGDPAIVHFVHRWWAWAVLAGVVVLARQAKRVGARRASIAIHSAVGAQILLGIATVMAGVPIWLAALHQLVGTLLVAATAWAAHEVRGTPMTIALVHVTFPDAGEAEQVARQLVEERLAACVSLVPCASIFRFEDEVQTAHEVSATFKTLPSRAGALARRIGELHSYDLPAVESWPVAAPDSVVAWVSEATTPE